MLPENYKRVLRELILPGLKILQENPRATTLKIPGRGSLPVEVFEDLVNISTPDRLKKVFRQTDVGNPTFILALENYITKLDEEKEETLEGKSPAEVIEEVEYIAEATRKISETNAHKIEPYQDVFHKQLEAYNRFMQGFPDEMGARIAAYYGNESSLSPIDQLSPAEITAITTTLSNQLKQKGPDFKTLGEIEHFINTSSSDLLTQSYRQKLTNNLHEAEIAPEVQAIIDEKVEASIASFKAGPTITDQAQKLHAIVQEKNQIEKRIHKYETDTIDRSVQLSRIIRNLPTRFKNPAFIEKLTIAVNASSLPHSVSQQHTLLETLVSTALEAEDEKVPKTTTATTTTTLSTEDILSLKSTAQAVEQRVTPSYPISTTVSQAPPTRPTPKPADDEKKIVSQALERAGDYPVPYAQNIIDDMYIRVEQSEDAAPQHTRIRVSREELNTFVRSIEDPDILERIKESPEGAKELLSLELKNSLYIPTQREYEALLVAPLVRSLSSSLSSTATAEDIHALVKKTLSSWSLPAEYKDRLNSSVIETVTQKVTATLLPIAASISELTEEDNQSINSAVLINALKTHGVFVDDTTFIVKNIHDSGILSSVVGYLQDSSTYTQTMEHVVNELQKIVPSRLLPNTPENKAVLEAIAKDMLYRATAFPDVARRLKSASTEEQSEALKTVVTDAYTSHYDDFFDNDYSRVAEAIIEENWDPEDEAEGHTQQHHHSVPTKKPINQLLNRQLSILDHTKLLWGESGTTAFFFTQIANTQRGKVLGFFVDSLSIIPGFRETFLTLYFNSDSRALVLLHEKILQDQRLLQRRINILESKGPKGREQDLQKLNAEYQKLSLQLKAIHSIQEKGNSISSINPLKGLFNLWNNNKDTLKGNSLQPKNSAVFDWIRKLPSQFSSFLDRTPFRLSAILPHLSFMQLGLKRAFNPSLGIIATPNIFSLEFGFPKWLPAFGSYFRKVVSVPFGALRTNVGFLAGIRGFFFLRMPRRILSILSPFVPNLLSGFRTGVGALPVAVSTGGNNALISFFSKKGQWILFGFLMMIIFIPICTILLNQITTQTAMIEGSQIVLNGPSGPSGPTGPLIPLPTPNIDGLVYYSQKEEPWASHPQNGQQCFDNGLIGYAGCGPVTAAMVLASFKDSSFNPINVLDTFYKFMGCNGSSINEIRNIIIGQGLFASEYIGTGGKDLQEAGPVIANALRNGRVVVAPATMCWVNHSNGIGSRGGCMGHLFMIVKAELVDSIWHVYGYDPAYSFYAHSVPIDYTFHLSLPMNDNRKAIDSFQFQCCIFAAGRP